MLCFHHKFVNWRSLPLATYNQTSKQNISAVQRCFWWLQASLTQARLEAMALSAAGLQQVPHVQFSILCPAVIDGQSVKIFCCVLSCKFPNEEASTPDTQATRLQGSQLQDAANAEILKEESRAYVIVDRDEKNEWWKVANVGDRFVVLQPWNILAQYHEEPVMLAFVAVPFPNE